MAGRLGTDTGTTPAMGRIGNASSSIGTGRIQSSTLTPSPSYFYTKTPSGATIGRSDLLDSSGIPLLGYRNPGDTATSTDMTRVATTFDPRTATTTPATTFQTPRAVPNAPQLKTSLGGTPQDELDHRMALELAGSNNPKNLGIQAGRISGPAKTSDNLENSLKAQVASGKISLQQAQEQLARSKNLPAPFNPDTVRGTQTPFDATPLGIGVNTIKGLPRAAWDSAKYISDTLTNMGVGMYNNQVNPSQEQKDYESKALPYAPSGQIGALGNPGTAVARQITRFLNPALKPYADKLAASIAINEPGGIMDQVNQGKLPPKIFNEIAGVASRNGNTSLGAYALQDIGDATQAVLSAYAGGAAEKAIVSKASAPIMDLAVQGFKSGAKVGTGFGVAQTLSSGTTNPKEIATNVGGSALFGGALGAGAHTAVPLLREAKAQYSTIPNKEGGFLRNPLASPEVKKSNEAIISHLPELEKVVNDATAPYGQKKVEVNLDDVAFIDGLKTQHPEDLTATDRARVYEIAARNGRTDLVDSMNAASRTTLGEKKAERINTQGGYVKNPLGEEPKKVSPVDKLIAEGKVKVQSINNRDTYFYKDSKGEWKRSIGEDNAVRMANGEPKPQAPLPQNLEERKIALDIQKEELKNNPLNNLSKYQARRGEFKGQLPEVTGNGKGTFGVKGDTILTEHLGNIDSETARAKYEKFKSDKASVTEQEAQLKQEIKQYKENTSSKERGLTYQGSRFKSGEDLVNYVSIHGSGEGASLNPNEMRQLVEYLTSQDEENKIISTWGGKVERGTIYKSYGGGQDIVLGKVKLPGFGGDSMIVAQINKNGKLDGRFRTHATPIESRDIIAKLGDRELIGLNSGAKTADEAVKYSREGIPLAKTKEQSRIVPEENHMRSQVMGETVGKSPQSQPSRGTTQSTGRARDVSSTKYIQMPTKNKVEYKVTGDTQKQRVESAIVNSERAKNELAIKGKETYTLGRKFGNPELKVFRDKYQSGIPIDEIASKSSNPAQAKKYLTQVKDYYDLQLAHDRAAGGQTANEPNHLVQNWNLDNPKDLARFNDLATQKGLQPYKGFHAQPKVFKTYAEGEAAGFKPKNPNMNEDLLKHSQQASNVISRQVLKKGLWEAAPRDVSIQGTGMTDKGKPFINSNIKGLEGISYNPSIHRQLKGFESLKNQDVFSLMKDKGFDPSKPSTYSKAWEGLKEGGVLNTVSTLYDKSTTAMKNLLLNFSGFHSLNVSSNFAGASIFHPLSGAKGLAYSAPSFFSEKATQGIIDGFKSKLVKGQDFSVFDAGLRSGVNMDRGLPAKGLVRLNPMTALSRAMFDRELHILKLHLVDQVFGSGKVLPESVKGRALGREINMIMGEMNNRTMNINPNTQKWLSRTLLAPQFTESKYKLIGDALTKSGNNGGNIARTAIVGKSLAMGTLATLGTVLATGKFPNLQQLLLNYTTSPSSQTDITNSKGQKQDIGYPQTFITEPSSAVSDPIHYAQARLAPVISDAISIGTNKDYYGNPVYDKNKPESALSQYGKNVGLGDLPIGVQSVIKQAQGKQTGGQTALQIAGLKTHISPNDPNVQQTNEANQLAQEEKDTRAKLRNEAKKQVDIIDALPDNEKEAAFQKIVTDNESLAREIKVVKNQKDLGFTSRDYAISSLGVLDGTRAKFITDQMKNMSSREERAKYWNELVGKKLITSRVAQEINDIMK